MMFFVGMHHPSAAKHVKRAFISVNALRGRKSDFEVGDWIMDSGAFSTIEKFGGYPHDVAEYAAHIRRWRQCGTMHAAVAQDFMCEPHMLERTGLSVAEHQRLTVERYVALRDEDCGGAYIMPVLQGYAPDDYARHVHQYGAALEPGAWVAVGSVCKRNGKPSAVAAVLRAIVDERPDLRLHGLGLKVTALREGSIADALHSADSMAWSYRARIEGRNGNDWREAIAFVDSIETQPVQMGWLL